MPEYGVFNDEGCIEAGLASPEAATEAAAGYVAEGEWEGTHGAAICPDHDEQEADTCEECLAGEDVC